MAAKGSKNKPKRLIFDSVRKPTAPPSQSIGKEKPEEKVHPAARKLKHKKKLELLD
jgi:hypothetical protein